jgi:hypothetical protein
MAEIPEPIRTGGVAGELQRVGSLAGNAARLIDLVPLDLDRDKVGEEDGPLLHGLEREGRQSLVQSVMGLAEPAEPE